MNEIRDQLFAAIDKEDLKTVQSILTKNPSLLEGRDAYILGWACEIDNLHMVQFLVDIGCDINGDDFDRPLTKAVMASSFIVTKWLLAKGAEVNLKGNYNPISWAVEENNLEMVRLLISAGANVNISLSKPLIYSAIHSGSKDMVEFLMEYDIDLNCSWGSWDSPLANALAGGQEEIIKILAERTNVSKDEINEMRSRIKDKMKTDFDKKLNEEDLKEVERELGLKIPPVYRAFLAEFPDNLMTEGMDGIYHSSEMIIRSTKSSREFMEGDGESTYPNNLIDIGWNGGDGIYCIREGDDGNTIYMFDQELGEINPEETLSLEEFIEKMRSWNDE